MQLFIHKACFDGLVSGALASWYVGLKEGASVTSLCPVDYDARPGWLSSELGGGACVVDFLYHPKAAYWWDHHPTTFISEECFAHYRSRQSSHVLFVPDAPSCASIIRSVAEEDGYVLPPHLSEAVQWADKLDSAAYSSPEDAVLLKSPASRISISLRVEQTTEYHATVLESLARCSLAEVAEQPACRDRITLAVSRHGQGLRLMQDNAHMMGNVATYRVAVDDELIDRMMAYYFFPDALFGLGLIRDKDKVRVTCNTNPWKPCPSIHLGRLFARYGGGGHQGVGSVVLPLTAVDQAESVFISVLAALADPDA